MLTQYSYDINPSHDPAYTNLKRVVVSIKAFRKIFCGLCLDNKKNFPKQLEP